MTRERNTGSMRGTAEWVIAVVGATLAKGTPIGAGPSRADLADAAERVLIAYREAGQDHVVTSGGVWALAWLEDDEVIEFAREVVGAWLESHHLALKWAGDGHDG
jgi:hypothetical protein